MDIGSTGMCGENVQVIWDMDGFEFQRGLVFPHANHCFPQSLYRGHITNPSVNYNIRLPLQTRRSDVLIISSSILSLENDVLANVEGKLAVELMQHLAKSISRLQASSH